MRESIEEKADRLLSAGRVRILHRGVDRVVAVVEGDHGRYCVSSSPTRPLGCECKAAERNMRCSHLICVELVTTARDRVAS
jgi:uncharacterized Zn finger protein